MAYSSRKERERRERINYVLNVAERLFADKGFMNVTMRQIAEKAEFALGTIYSFFRGKKQIYHDLIEKKSEMFVSFLEKEIDSESHPRQQVEKFIEAKMTYLLKNLSFLKLYLAEVNASHLLSEEGLNTRIKNKYDELLRRLSEVMGRGISEGIFIKGKPEVLAKALDGLTNAMVFTWLNGKRPSSPSEEIRIVKNMFFHGILAKG